jgi:hypothetical protein
VSVKFHMHISYALYIHYLLKCIAYLQGRPLHSNVEARCFIEKVGGNEFLV